jgi:hypothetical protein
LSKLGFMDRLRAAAGIVMKGSGQGIPAFWFARAIETSSQETLDRPYANSAWVQAAIAKIAGPVASVGVDFYRAKAEMAGVKGQRAEGRGQRTEGRRRTYITGRGWVTRDTAAEIELPLMNDFMREPMEGLGYADFVEATIGWMKMAGEAFWLIPEDNQVPFPEARSRDQGPKVIVARPDRMRHIVENSQLVGWQYRDGQSKMWNLLPEDLIHLKRWNPYDRWRGLGEYESSMIAAEGDWLAGKFKRNLMANNGDTGPYIIAKNGIPTDPQREQILQDLKSKRAAQQRGDFRPIFLTGDISVEDPKVRTVDAAYIDGRIEDHHEIFVAFGVPPSLADVKAAYSIGSASDFYQLITTACVPAGQKLADGLERLTEKLTGQAVEILLDWDEHPVFQEVRKERLASVDVLWSKGMPMEAISEYLGLELVKYEGWDVGFLPFNVAPAATVTEPPEDPKTDPSLGEEQQPDSTGGNGGNGEKPKAIQEMLEALRGRKNPNAEGKGKKKNAALWTQHMRQRQPIVRAYQSKASRVINEWRGKTLAAFEKVESSKSKGPSRTGQSSTAAPEVVEMRSLIDLIFDRTGFTGALRVAINAVGNQALQTAGDQLFSEVGKTDPWKVPPAKALEFQESRADGLASVGQTARSQINTALVNGFEEGKSIADITDDIRGVFNNLSKFEAKRIAMTETTSAFGFARDEAMKQAGVQYKSWLSSHGPNVREAHADAEDRYEESPIPVDEPFMVDGEELMYPGDPDGSAGNVINCQCVSLAVAKPEEEE